MTPNRALRNWLKVASPDQARALATASGTSVPHLRHIAAGRRGVSADLAQKLAHASTHIGDDLELDQRALCGACARCPLVADIDR